MNNQLSQYQILSNPRNDQALRTHGNTAINAGPLATTTLTCATPEVNQRHALKTLNLHRPTYKKHIWQFTIDSNSRKNRTTLDGDTIKADGGDDGEERNQTRGGGVSVKGAAKRQVVYEDDTLGKGALN